MYVEMICNNYTSIEIGAATLPPPIENTPLSTCIYIYIMYNDTSIEIGAVTLPPPIENTPLTTGI